MVVGRSYPRVSPARVLGATPDAGRCVLRESISGLIAHVTRRCVPVPNSRRFWCCPVCAIRLHLRERFLALLAPGFKSVADSALCGVPRDGAAQVPLRARRIGVRIGDRRRTGRGCRSLPRRRCCAVRGPRRIGNGGRCVFDFARIGSCRCSRRCRAFEVGEHLGELGGFFLAEV